MQSEAQYIPTPHLRDLTYKFSVPTDFEIRHIQLLSKKRCLLILDDGKRNMYVYLDPLNDLYNAVQNKKHKKPLHAEKYGHSAIIAYDETKRILAVCTSTLLNVSYATELFSSFAHLMMIKTSMKIHTFVFDESFATLHGQGSPIELAGWYSEMPRLLSMHILPATGELALVEAQGQVRVYSPATQQFR